MEIQSRPWNGGGKEKQIRAERLLVEGDLIKYTGNGKGIGVYVSLEAVTTENNYFELTILNTDMFGAVSIGVCHVSYPLNTMPGWAEDSLGYHGDDGMLYRGNVLGYRFGPRCGRGDRMGCGVRPVPLADKDATTPLRQQTHYVYFTKNGKEIGCVSVVMPREGLYPCVGLAGPQDVVRLGGPYPPPSPGPVILSPHSPPSTRGEVTFMAVDCNEDDWRTLHDVKLDGQCVTYSGAGQCIEDVGLAVAKHALCPASHYFQIQILDPGRHAYITIGLTKKRYPRRCHPGWREGSVAYHADDGRVFTGNNSGWGTPFGPPCDKGDIMGCGILYPRDYSYNNYYGNNDDSSADDSDDCLDNTGTDDIYSSDCGQDDYDDFSASSPGDIFPPGRNIFNSDATLESPDVGGAREISGGEQQEDDDEDDEDEPALEGEEESVVTALKEVRSLCKAAALRNKRKGRRRTHSGRAGVISSSTPDHHSSGFTNRNSVLIKDLQPHINAVVPRKRNAREPIVQVFFTRNGALLGRVEAVVPRGGFYPTISLGGKKETVRVDLRPLSG